MATPFIVGMVVAGSAYAARASIRAFQRFKANPSAFFASDAMKVDSKISQSAIGEGFLPKMDRDEALAILGLERDADEKTIKDSHKKLMMKNHPDKGGSSYLTTKVNEARKVLNNADSGTERK